MIPLVWPPMAFAQEEAPAESPPAESPNEDMEARVAALEAKLAALEARQRRPVAHLGLPDDVRVRPTGYVDFGAFDAAGDGVSYVRDVGHAAYPEYKAVPWVFTGDPWANAINSQGDSADLGLDRTNVDRWDPIASGGHPSFLVNMITQGVAVSVGSSVFVETAVNVEPRQGELGSPGDVVDVDLAYFDWVPWRGRDLHVFAGKFESTFGMEYRNRKAVDRMGITPSLMARYTVGSPTGVKVRGSVLDEHVNLNVALTNGGTMTERFSHFHDEIDSNAGKTVSGRLGIVLPVEVEAELGVSGMAGSQDGQRDEGIRSDQMGVDARIRTGRFWAAAEYVIVDAPGGGVDQAASVDAEGGYVEAGWHVLPWAAGLARVDRRDAMLRAETNLYVSDVVRFTGAARFDLTFNLIGKVEYLRIIELEGPEIRDDVLTFSAIARY